MGQRKDGGKVRESLRGLEKKKDHGLGHPSGLERRETVSTGQSARGSQDLRKKPGSGRKGTGRVAAESIATGKGEGNTVSKEVLQRRQRKTKLEKKITAVINKGLKKEFDVRPVRMRPRED